MRNRIEVEAQNGLIANRGMRSLRSSPWLVAIALVTVFFFVGCRKGGGGGSGDGEIDPALFAEDTGLGMASFHWDTLNETTGPFVSIVFFDDGSGQVAFVNDAFARGAESEVSTRTLYPMSWTDMGGGTIVVSLDGPEFMFELQDVDVDGDGNSFEATYSDDEGSRDFDFTKQEGAIST